MMSLIAFGVKRDCISHCEQKDETPCDDNLGLTQKNGAEPLSWNRPETHPRLLAGS